jgi:hypothetical protein
MSLSIRQADIQKDRRVLIEFLYKNLTEQSDDCRLNWLYESNPYGKARVWIMFDEKKDAIIGCATAFPRLMNVSGKDLICWNLGDFAINENFRILGPALLLQRACLKPVFEGKIPFCYDHPSNKMMAIYRRMGILASGEVIRFAKPLRSDRKVEAFSGKGMLSRGLSAMINNLMAVIDHRRYAYKNYEISSYEGMFDDEFSELDQKVSINYKVCGRRTAAYLNWRYKENPLNRYKVLTVRQDGQLLAYIIFYTHGRDSCIADLFGEEKEEAIKALLATVIAVLRQQQIVTLSMPVLDTSPLIPFLRWAGFCSRECTPIVICTQPHGYLDGLVNDGKNWFLTHGDRDI